MAQILFKPQQEGVKVNPANVTIAHVVRVDRIRDLALLEVNPIPSYVQPLILGSDTELQVGADVYAIGHPTGEAWTFTRGLISQLRNDYDWKDENGKHTADVIQTQTPINVGNSGGPLIGVSGGNCWCVNSFKTPDSEGLNFAVSVKDVDDFLIPKKGDREIIGHDSSCKPVRLYDGRNKKNDGHLVQIDTNCDGRPDVAVVLPDDTTKPKQAFIDTNYDGKVDVIINDFNRDNLWDVSFHDTHLATVRLDLVGFHPKGDVAPSLVREIQSVEGLHAIPCAQNDCRAPKTGRRRLATQRRLEEESSFWIIRHRVIPAIERPVHEAMAPKTLIVICPDRLCMDEIID